VERRENPRLADRRCDAVPVQVRPQVWTDTREDHAHPLAHDISEQIAYGLRRGVVERSAAYDVTCANQAWERMSAFLKVQIG
jgi:hypothetical protein